MTEAEGWAGRAGELAVWTMARLVCRTDRFGTYFTDDGKTRQMTYPPKKPVEGSVSPARLARHFAARATGDVMGLHSLGPDSMGRSVAVDIDRHDDDIEADPDANFRYALVLTERLATLGFMPLLSESNGRGGYHIRGLLDRPTPGHVLFWFGRWLVRDWLAHGFAAAPETYPKQTTIPPGGYGNWLRLPGRHHTREFWSRVYDGRGWLTGGDAADFIIATDAAPPEAVPFDEIADYCDRMTYREATPKAELRKPTGQTEGDRAGDDFNRRASWVEVLEPHGWRVVRRRADGTFEWVRPGKKDGGMSATTGYCKRGGLELMYAFTTSAGPIPTAKGRDKFTVYTLLNHDGDFRAAARALYDAGYGVRRQSSA